MQKLKVGILGATGSVGQRFIYLLESHPWFEVTEVVASDRSAGKLYKDAVQWKMDKDIPESVARLKVKQADPSILGCDVVFSGLDASVAGEIESACAYAGFPVISNSKNHRMEEDVPLLIPDVNSDHISLIDIQRKNHGYTTGFIATNPNCSTTGLVIALKPLEDAFGIEKLFVVTMQAVSGAGYPGIPSMDILDNVVPFIGGEEDKVELEPKKLLGRLTEGKVQFADMTVSAQCNRVSVIDGHLESVSVKLRKPAEIAQIKQVMDSYSAEPQALGLPSAPKKPIIIREEENRPQPRLDRNAQMGMAVSVGRIRPCTIFDVRFTVLSHNTIRGAAGGAILNAELLYKKGYIQAKSTKQPLKKDVRYIA